jgi:excinuclease UvrABC nuclease subunit
MCCCPLLLRRRRRVERGGEMMSPSKAWPQVWLVDDSEVDLMLATRVLERSGLVRNCPR